jgi:uncharacterized membrane protein YheB (UPF0754 family)
MIRAGRRVAIVALPALALAAGAAVHFLPQLHWADWVFKIALSGTVGIWTNYFAIKMLFRPHARTAFGRQGLIPARRRELADAIGEAVADELLDAETVLSYLEEHQVLQRAADRLLDAAHAWMAKPDNRRRVVGRAGEWLQRRGMEYLEELLPRAEEYLTGLIRRHVTLEAVWPHLRTALAEELARPSTRETVSRVLQRFIEENSPRIASVLNSVIDRWIGERGAVTRVVLELGRSLFDIDEDFIAAELRKAVQGPEFFSELMDFLDRNVEAVERVAGSEEIQRWLSGLLESGLDRLEDWVRRTGLDLARTRLSSLLESDAFWRWLDGQVDPLVERAEQSARRRVYSPEFRDTARRLLLRLSESVDVRGMVSRRIDGFDLEELERLVFRVSGDNLAGIELFGGVLGMLAGLVLISPVWLLLLPAGVGAFLLAERAASGLGR